MIFGLDLLDRDYRYGYVCHYKNIYVIIIDNRKVIVFTMKQAPVNNTRLLLSVLKSILM